MTENERKEYHFITHKCHLINLPKRERTSKFLLYRTGHRKGETNRIEELKKIIKEINRTKQVPNKKEWTFSVQKCERCEGRVLGGITCDSCGMYYCSNCRETKIVGGVDLVLCTFCAQCYNRMIERNWFQQKINEARDKPVVTVHLKVTGILILFDEAYRGMMAFSEVVSMDDGEIIKECQDRLKEFQIVLQKVMALKEVLKRFEHKSEVEKRIIHGMFCMWSIYYKERVKS